MILAYDITNSSVTFLGEDGVPRSADVTHVNYQRIRDGLLDGASADDLIQLVDTKVAIEGKTFGLVTVGADSVYYKAKQLNGYLVEKLLAMLGDGLDITPWAILLDNLMVNPEISVRDRLPLFLEQAQMPITEDGHFLAWRLVKDDYWDIYTGNTFHCVSGALLQMPREACNPNPEETCSAGIHVAAFGYLDSYGFDHSGRRCMLTKVNPASVVAVPVDYNNQKLRVCEALILREVAKEYVPALFGRDDHIVTEDGWIEDETYPVAEWRDAVANDDTTLGYDDWVEEQYEMATSSATWKTAVINGDTELSFQNWASQQ
jgi:hypothetical protein